MNRIESEWLVAWAIVKAGIRRATGFNGVIAECPLNVGRDVLMKTCKKCGREYYADCIPCTFRNGGDMVDGDGHHNDLFRDWAYHRDNPDALENTLAWMRVPISP